MGHRNRILFIVLTVSLSLTMGLSAIAGIETTQSISAEKLTVHNLIGEIQIEKYSGSDFEVTVNLQGDDLADHDVDVVITTGRSAKMEIRFPLSESRNYVYPRISGSTSFSVDSGASWISQLLGGKQIKVRGSGRGLEIWADITIRVPHGKELIVDHGVGTITAHGVSGDFNLSTRAGSIEASDISGSLVLDTGSGHVSADRIEGTLLVDTGSGHVSVSHFSGSSVSVDTGSGSVTISDIDSASVMVDTGSGDVKAHSIAADEMTIGTGSGSVIAELDRMGRGRFKIDTGSGSISLQLPLDASAEIEADTGSGRVSLDLRGAVRIRHEDDDSVELTLGDGGADVRLDAGSGSIRITQ